MCRYQKPRKELFLFELLLLARILERVSLRFVGVSAMPSPAAQEHWERCRIRQNRNIIEKVQYVGFQKVYVSGVTVTSLDTSDSFQLTALWSTCQYSIKMVLLMFADHSTKRMGSTESRLQDGGRRQYGHQASHLSGNCATCFGLVS